MRESKFIEQNKEKWHQFELRNMHNGSDPELLEKAFVETSEDLSFAQTFYKNRSVKVFLNNLLAPVYTKVYRSKRLSVKSINTFFTYNAPLAAFKARKFILLSFIWAIMGFCIGFFSSKSNPNFPNLVLGEPYVSLTKENIQNKNPFAIYKSQDRDEMFFSIAANNLRVAIFFFVLGAFFMFGSLLLLLLNTIMLGAFTYLFYSADLSWGYMLVVYQHGTLEILGMILESAAGMMLGYALVSPGTLSRTRALQNTSKFAVQMFIVLIPIILIAAYIESYVTRLASDLISKLLTLNIHSYKEFIENFSASDKASMFGMLAIIILSILFIAFYFIVFPYLKFRKNNEILGADKMESDDKFLPYIKTQVYSLGNILLFGLETFKNQMARILPYIFGTVAMAVVIVVLYNQKIFQNLVMDESLIKEVDYTDSADIIFNMLGSIFGGLFGAFKYFTYILSLNKFPFVLIPCTFLLYFLLFFRTGKYNLSRFNLLENETKKSNFVQILNKVFFCILLCALQYLFFDVWWLYFIFIFPLVVYMITMSEYAHNNSIGKGFSDGISLYFRSFWSVMGLVIIQLLLLCVLLLGFYLLINTGKDIADSLFPKSEFITKPQVAFAIISNAVIFPLIVALGVYSLKHLAISSYEKHFGVGLFNKIEQIEFKKKAYGIELEQ